MTRTEAVEAGKDVVGAGIFVANVDFYKNNNYNCRVDITYFPNL